MLHVVDFDFGGVDDGLCYVADCLGALNVERVVLIGKPFQCGKQMVSEVFYFIFDGPSPFDYLFFG